MVRIYSKALNQSLYVERLIGQYKGSSSGPTLIFVGGIHGNEPSGVFALRKVIDELHQKKISIKGNIYAIAGNLGALECNKRYNQQDLNRLWTEETMKSILANKQEINNKDIAEQIDIYNTIQNILATENGPFYFMDLHTTSSQTIPFLTVNDSLLNRKFTMQYPLPIILGIEEYLDGPLLSYINELGYVAFGFESGHHDDPRSIENHIAFIYLSLIFAGCLTKTQIDVEYYHEILSKNALNYKNMYEIYWRHEIQNGEVFTMKPGFINFQKIEKGQELATSNGKKIYAFKSGKIFMPLYQSQGNDGFFAIRKTPKFFLNLSATLRTISFDHILPLLPGVKWDSNKKDILTVNQKIARFFTKQFFHLLGYRSKQIDVNHFKFKNREAASRKKEYSSAPWVKNKM